MKREKLEMAQISFNSRFVIFKCSPSNYTLEDFPLVKSPNKDMIGINYGRMNYFRDDKTRAKFLKHMSRYSVLIEKTDGNWTLTEMIEYFNLQKDDGFIHIDDQIKDILRSENDDVLYLVSDH